MGEQYISYDIEGILVGETLPGTLYLYLDFRFITFRAVGDTVDRNAYDRLLARNIRQLFILEQDRPKFEEWKKTRSKEEQTRAPTSDAERALNEVREDTNRKMLDIFHSEHPNKIVAQSLTASKKLVSEVMKLPYTTRPISQLQTYSRGTVDHSINVSILSVYLAMQMGYTHAVILQHVGAGALLHDIGKPKVPVSEADPKELQAEKLKQHPSLATLMLEGLTTVPNEVKLIISQHHECHDGSGFPKGLRGSAIYDLTRIVSIANTFDELVADGAGSLVERQRKAVQELDQNLSSKFDPQKLDKALKILKLGL